MTTSVLPQDLLAALPADPAAQLELAQKISSNAFASRSAGLEAEVAQLRAQLGAKAQALKAAEGAAAELRVELDEARERARQSLEEQSKLVGEKNSLAEQVRLLPRASYQCARHATSCSHHAAVVAYPPHCERARPRFQPAQPPGAVVALVHHEPSLMLLRCAAMRCAASPARAVL